MNQYVIEVRRIAESEYGLISKGGDLLKFDNIETAREFGKNNIEGSRFIASWEVITVESAKSKKYEI